MNHLTCPYCKATIDHDRADLWEYENEDEMECPECEKSFILLVEVTYEYTGRRLECKEGNHDWLEWRPTDVDEAMLERWKSDDYFKNKIHEGVYTFFCQNCSSCDQMRFSKHFPLGTRLEQSEIKPR